MNDDLSPMNRHHQPESSDDADRTYNNLVSLWTAGVRDFHSLLATYLTANSIFVAAIGFLLTQPMRPGLFDLFVVMLCVLGIGITLQMALVLARFDAQNALWEWQLRGIERSPLWTRRQLFVDLHRFRDQKEGLRDDVNIPPAFEPNWILRHHRRWWARRAVSFPLYFGFIYIGFLVWGILQFSW